MTAGAHGHYLKTLPMSRIASKSAYPGISLGSQAGMGYDDDDTLETDDKFIIYPHPVYPSGGYCQSFGTMTVMTSG